MGIKEEVVISGIAGYFPESDNVEELKELLFNKVNGITTDSRRWSLNMWDVPSGTGKIKNFNGFDRFFFKAHSKLASVKDPLSYLGYERAIEAIIDAGLTPADLDGTNTAVIMGTFQSPSFSICGGWTNGMNSLSMAKRMIENGLIESAIVGCTNLVLKAEMQYQYIDRLTKTNFTKSLSDDADGYNRSEACIVMFLQKGSIAKRSYGTLLSTNLKNFGDHAGVLTSHSKEFLKSTIVEAYQEAKLNPYDVGYIEAYGSGIKIEDSMEMNVIGEVFCTKKRKTTLKIGSLKSNIGHTEECNLFASIIKAIITFECGYIPPNINFKEPHTNIPAIQSGQMKIVTEKTPFNEDIIGINSFSFTNSFSHIILKRNNKTYKNQIEVSGNNIPKLIFVSGRIEDNVRGALNIIKTHGTNDEYTSLTNDVFRKTIPGHYYRSFDIITGSNESRTIDIQNVTLQKRPVWYIFSGMGSQWPGMGTDLLKIPIFAETIKKCDIVLRKKKIDIFKILTDLDTTIFDNILHSFVGITAIQLGLVDVLYALEIEPDGIVGHSMGEVACAYADGCFTIEEAILASYYRGSSSNELDLIPGMMAAIGLGYAQMKDIVPEDIDIACHNSSSSCTISGPVESVEKFVAKLKSEGIFAKAVNVSNIAYHSRYIKPVAVLIESHLKEIIKNPKLRSSKWISSSVPESEWDSDLARYSSAEYHANNNSSSVLFEEATRYIPKDAIAIEIAPHGLLQAILKRSFPETVTNIPLTKNVFGNSIKFLLNAFGKMYLNDLNPNIQAIYPPIDYPVSRGTPFLHSLPFWDHSNELSIVVTSIMKESSTEEIININLNDYQDLIHHNFQGNCTAPPSFLLFLAWKCFLKFKNINNIFSVAAIIFNDIKIEKRVEISTNDSIQIYFMLQPSGLFEFSCGENVILTGRMNYLKDSEVKISNIQSKVSVENEKAELFLSKNEISVIFKNKGYHINNEMMCIESAEFFDKRIKAQVKSINNSFYFLDNLLKIALLENLNSSSVEDLEYIEEFIIDPRIIENKKEESVSVIFNNATKEVTSEGIYIKSIKYIQIQTTDKLSSNLKLENCKFHLFNKAQHMDIVDFIESSVDLITNFNQLKSSNLKKKLNLVIQELDIENQLIKKCTEDLKYFLNKKMSIDFVILNSKEMSRFKNDSEIYVAVTTSSNIKDSIVKLTTDSSYILVLSNEFIYNIDNWKNIVHQKFNNCCITLLKKRVIINENSVFIKTDTNKVNLILWKTISECKTSNKKIYLISKIEPPMGIYAYVLNILETFKSENLRFIFMLDSDVSEIYDTKDFYEDQISKDLLINIYKNGGWGLFKNVLHENITLENNFTQEKLPIQISLTKVDGLSIKYLGINHCNIAVDEYLNNEIGSLDYTGFTKNEKSVMGILSYNQKENEVIYEKELAWPVPKEWTLEDAVTVPMTYSTVYYMLKVLTTLRKFKTVLITSGTHPIGYAAISVCLPEVKDVYVIVENVQQAVLISKSFPSLSESNIIVNENNTFDINIKLKNKNVAVDIVLNFLKDKGFDAAVRSLNSHGKFFQYCQSDMKRYKKLGLKIFLENISFYTIFSKKFLNECDETKRIVHKEFMNGLSRGIIKPLKKTIVPMSFSSEKLLDTLKKSSFVEKFIIPVDDSILKTGPMENKVLGLYRCNPEYDYVIIGNKTEWLDVVEWLVCRGAQNIVILINNYILSSIDCRRFNQLLSKKISLKIESYKSKKTKEDTVYWLDRLTNWNRVGGLFLVNQTNQENVQKIAYSFEKLNKLKSTLFVCISCNSKSICENLKSIGINVINISSDKVSNQHINTKMILKTLDSLLINSEKIISSIFICSIDRNEKKNNLAYVLRNLPETTEELVQLLEKIEDLPNFKEVQTKSPRYSHVKEIPPIFVIPGFNSKRLEALYKRLQYPTFEARIPEIISSTSDLVNLLVKKLREISSHKMVSLIGESWGGVIALKIAQILESQGIMVAVTLLDGDPDYVFEWLQILKSNQNSKIMLEQNYRFPLQNYISKEDFNKNELKNSIRRNNTTPAFNVLKSLDIIWNRLDSLMKSTKNPYKLLSRVHIFTYNRVYDFKNSPHIKEFCSSIPNVQNISENNVENEELYRKINSNAAIMWSNSIEKSIAENYNNFYFDKYII
ncbi:fatty acid synthase-like isoform X2 [Daktulosphaira vitifoliae]|uniref:fatty acid synthase-like isoform X2 n=1 Tax=Daktulosphaira vitifoliae TaxID=58002 RepID=UPI0021AA9CB3|nr:fatty acid synthase-like isoform X2 [Daktulosphaira vitifoliae]